jgi:hypothetical protein
MRDVNDSHLHFRTVKVFNNRISNDIFGLSFVGIVCSNTASCMGICLLGLLYVRQRSLRRADRSSRGVLPNVVCLSKILKPHNEEDLATTDC